MTRLSHSPTQQIDRKREISFTYRGHSMTGFPGDSVASSLFANGIRIFSRSIKYHRPRGLYSMDGESSNCLMEINGLPNVHVEVTPLREGMAVQPQNVVGSPEWDWLGFLDKMSWALPAGFYYRIFHKPYFLWPFFQNRIRAAAGIGRFNPSWQGGHHDELYLNADVCVVGGGPAGISAAMSAGTYGLRVVLLEARPWLGGFYDWRTKEDTSGLPLHERARKLVGGLAGKPNIRILRSAFVNGLWGDNLVTAYQVGGTEDGYEERYIEVHAKSVVVATGCTERPLLFQNNERPGVVQVACAHRLARTYGLLPGKRAVFSIGDDIALEAALDLADLGLEIACVADCRLEGWDPGLAEALAFRNIPYFPGWMASKAEGRKVVSGVVLKSLDNTKRKKYECDVLVASAGFTPASGLLSMSQGRMGYDKHTNFFLPKELPPRLHAAGRLLGYVCPNSIETSGRLAGLTAAVDCSAEAAKDQRKVREMLAKLPGPFKSPKVVTAPGIGSGRKTFICFDEDVTVKHIAQSCQRGFDVPELAKRFSATGTGPGQSGIPGHNLPLLLSQFRGEEVGGMLPTTVRPPLVPTLLATYAGPKHDIFKCTPLHETHEKAGAIFRRIGSWKRARYFSRDLSCREEVANVRENVGMIDVSTLGKFRIFGPDSIKALQRVCVGNMAEVREGKVKYSVMCNDDGCLIDDGVIVKLGENDYYFTASTGRAESTIEWFRYHTRYDSWYFHMVNLTDAIGAINLAGPRSRQVLQKLTDADISNTAFPFMAYKEITLGGYAKARVMRLGFAGEMSFEIHVPASLTQCVWEWLMDAGKEFEIKPFGLEAQNILRLEKGHIIIGQESEIRTTLHDLGLGFLWFRDKIEAKTVGAPALRFTENQERRLKLVGFKMVEPTQTPGDGAIVIDDAARGRTVMIYGNLNEGFSLPVQEDVGKNPENTIRGYVCTARYSHTLGESIGLAFVDATLAKEGSSLKIFQEGLGERRLSATVVKTPFYDPEGKRLKV